MSKYQDDRSNLKEMSKYQIKSQGNVKSSTFASNRSGIFDFLGSKLNLKQNLMCKSLINSHAFLKKKSYTCLSRTPAQVVHLLQIFLIMTVVHLLHYN